MMRILHVFDHSLPMHSGYTFRSAAILREQRRLGWETFHVTSAKQRQPVADSEETVDGLHFFRTPAETAAWARWPVGNQIAVVQGLKRRLSSIVQQVRPDILHAHSPALNGLAALATARRFRLPLVYEVRAFWEDAAADQGTSRPGGLRYRLTKALETHVLRRASAVTTICQGLKQDIIGRGIPADKITVIPNAVDPSAFSPGSRPDPDLQAQLGLQGSRVLGFIGSFFAYEGMSLLLDALPGLLDQAPDLRVLLVGGGEQEASLRAQANRLGIGQKVVMVGRVPHDVVQRYYDLVDLLVYPRSSIRLTELVTPLKPLEAMAQQRLFIASDVGGHQELVRDGETGVLFRADDIADFQRKALDLLAHPERWPSLKANGRRLIENERNWGVSVDRYRPVYERLLSA